MICGLATLNYPHMQATFERMGWQIIGIAPGFDRELVSPGVVRRVYEAVYARVLVPDDLLRPNAENLTPAARTLSDLLFPGQRLGGTGPDGRLKPTSACGVRPPLTCLAPAAQPPHREASLP